jgi:hypothetical protein
MSEVPQHGLQDVSLAVELIAHAEDNRRLTETLLEIHSEGRMADVTAALVFVTTHLVERVALLEHRTAEAITDEMRTLLIPLKE